MTIVGVAFERGFINDLPSLSTPILDCDIIFPSCDFEEVLVNQYILWTDQDDRIDASYGPIERTEMLLRKALGSILA